MSSFVYSGAPILPSKFAGLGNGGAPAPTVSSVTNASNPWRATANGVTGTGYVNGATVTINGDACTSVVFNSSTSLSFNSPVFTDNGGPYDVVVTNPDSQTGTLAAAYVVTADPLDFTGLKAWYEGDIVTQSGGAASAWPDQSGNANDVVAAGSARPSVVSAGLLGHNYLSYDGIANTMAGAGAATFGAGNNLSIFMVTRATGKLGYPGVVLYGAFGAAGAGGVIDNTGNALPLLTRNSTFVATFGDITQPTWHRLSAVMRSAGTEQGWVDGIDGGSTAMGGTLATTGVISFADRSGVFTPIDIAETALYNTNQENNRRYLEYYFLQKYFWGVQRAQLQNLTLANVVTQAVDATKIISAGELDVSGVGSATADSFASYPSGSDTYLFAATSTDGLMSVRYAVSTVGSVNLGALILTVRGVDVLQTGGGGVGFTTGDVIAWRAWYRVSTGECGVRFTVDGVTIEQLGSTTGTALAAPTVAYMGSDVSGSNSFPGTWTNFTVHNVADPAPIGAIAPFEFLTIGDSIASSYPSLTNLSGFIYPTGTGNTKPGVMSLAASGATITGEQGLFDSNIYKKSPHLRAVIIEVGINDLIQGASAATWITRYQGLVNDVAAALPGIPIIGVELSPCRAYLDTNDPGQYAQWLLVNTAIGGGGGTPITGLAAVVSSHVTTMNDGSDHLAAAYELPLSFADGLHPNQAGRQVIGLAVRASLISIGITP